jgi:hypothetical protein
MIRRFEAVTAQHPAVWRKESLEVTSDLAVRVLALRSRSAVLMTPAQRLATGSLLPGRQAGRHSLTGMAAVRRRWSGGTGWWSCAVPIAHDVIQRLRLAE